MNRTKAANLFHLPRCIIFAKIACRRGQIGANEFLGKRPRGQSFVSSSSQLVINFGQPFPKAGKNLKQLRAEALKQFDVVRVAATLQVVSPIGVESRFGIVRTTFQVFSHADIAQVLNFDELHLVKDFYFRQF